VLEERIVMPDPSSATLVHKLLDAPASAAAAARGGARRGQVTEQGEFKIWRQQGGTQLHCAQLACLTPLLAFPMTAECCGGRTAACRL
jgi:hypothetical protein